MDNNRVTIDYWCASTAIGECHLSKFLHKRNFPDFIAIFWVHTNKQTRSGHYVEKTCLWIDGWSTDEICKELDITATNSWVMLYRARMLLRSCLEKKWLGAQQ